MHPPLSSRQSSELNNVPFRELFAVQRRGRTARDASRKDRNVEADSRRQGPQLTTVVPELAARGGSRVDAAIAQKQARSARGQCPSCFYGTATRDGFDRIEQWVAADQAATHC